ncbi:hypothetical protein HK100_011522 [Physocladia obscura]|uniref:Uncharacterized protein n=1 Tax=Physocladia obscura TaxID=109957 RepID=A0AAD5XGK2_9FUNG|nr:hypothetical protein HK100_011522 [Physocladia obscura]
MASLGETHAAARTGARRRVAIVIGGTRGIGASTAYALAEHGYTVVVAGRAVDGGTDGVASDVDFSSAASSAASVSAAINARLGVAGLDLGLGRTRGFQGFPLVLAVPLPCDVCDHDSIDRLVATTTELFGSESLCLVVYNAGAIFWAQVKDTPSKRFNLLNRVNEVGLYKTVDTVLPIFLKNKYGRFLVVSPPIYSRFFRGKTAYAMGKVAMTVLTHGLAMDLDEQHPDFDIAISSLWPATAIKSAVTNHKNVSPKLLRHPAIFADAVVAIADQNKLAINGHAFIDEDFLRSFCNVSDFSKYRIDPAIEPPRMMPKIFPSLLVQEQDDRGFSVDGDSGGKAKVAAKL